MRWCDAARARWRLLFAQRADQRVDREFAFHIEQETDRLVNECHLSADEARRRALAAFGGVEKHKAALREGRPLARLDAIALDLKLARRLLVKYPWLTIVGSAAMAFGIAAGAAIFEVRQQLVAPLLPLDAGAQIVGLRGWDASGNRPRLPTADDFERWRRTLTSVHELSAVHLRSRNLITEDRHAEPEAVAAMTASAFVVAGVPPLIGRTLIEADEEPGASPVVVIGYELWQRRFGGDANVIGRSVRLGPEPMTVVGVMPEGFGFPVAHGLWIPLTRTSRAGTLSREPSLFVFGRLASGVSRARAEAEVQAIGLTATETTESAQLRLQVVPYATLMADPGDIQAGVALGNIFSVGILLVVCANVALLTFARAATREAEIAVRGALGAGRTRIVTQLLVEALALAAIAAAIGLAGATAGLRSFLTMYRADSGQPLPFWIRDTLSPSTMLYAGALTLAGAAIVGVIPALLVTGSGFTDRLRRTTAGGGGPRFGGPWTAVISVQVAVTLMFPATAFFFHRWVVRGEGRTAGVAATEYLSARLEVDGETSPGGLSAASGPEPRGRLRWMYEELEKRVLADPGVAGFTAADHLPGTVHPRWRIDVEGELESQAAAGGTVSVASVATNFFDVMRAPARAGRTFTAADAEPDAAVAIVNESFVSRRLGGRNPIGLRLRRAAAPDDAGQGRWLSIVGVVRDLGMVEDEAGLYQPIAPEAAAPLNILILARDRPLALAERVRAGAAAIDPQLQLHDVMTLDAAGANTWLESQYLSWLLIVPSAMALVLSLATLYAVTSVTVVRRTREIGLRVALGADRRGVMAAVLRRPLAQVGLGMAIGAVAVAFTFRGLFGSAPTAVETTLIALYSLLMMAICLLSCVVPARRALAVEPAAALKID